MAKIDLQKYHTAILLVKDAALSSNPIKRTEFIEKHELTPGFFRVMEDLKIIKEHSANNLTGSVFTWLYKQASNETDSKITLLVTEKIQEINRAVYLKYSSPESKARKKKHIMTSAVRKPKKHKDEIVWNGPSVVVKEGEPVMFEVPTSQIAPEEFFSSPETQGILEKSEERQEAPKTSGASKISFELNGSYSKQDLLDKVMALIEDKGISSFNISVSYK